MEKNNLYGLQIDESKFNGSKVFSGRYYLLAHCLKNIPENSVACEVGVAEGFFSQIILDLVKPSKLILIDLYQHNSPHREYVKANHYQYITKKFLGNDTVSLKRGLSWDMLNTLDSNSLDYIYVDGDHSYNSVKKDIVSAYRVIKPGGIIQFNDYTTYSPLENAKYGVMHAVNEFIQTFKPEILGVSLDKNGYNDIALKVLKL